MNIYTIPFMCDLIKSYIYKKIIFKLNIIFIKKNYFLTK